MFIIIQHFFYFNQTFFIMLLIQINFCESVFLLKCRYFRSKAQELVALDVDDTLLVLFPTLSLLL